MRNIKKASARSYYIYALCDISFLRKRGRLPILRLLYVSSLLRVKLSRWDGLALFVVITGLTLLIWGSREMAVPFIDSEPVSLSLDPIHLPYYALQILESDNHDLSFFGVIWRKDLPSACGK